MNNIKVVTLFFVLCLLGCTPRQVSITPFATKLAQEVDPISSTADNSLSQQSDESLQTSATLTPSHIITPVFTTISTPSFTINITNQFTSTASETVIMIDAVRSEKIFHWNHRGGYGSFELDNLYTSFQPIVPKPKNIPQPIEVDGLLFASQKEETAFLYRNAEGVLELWISDMNLDHPQRLWVDEKNWLGPEKTSSRLTTFQWGPGENSVIIKNQDNHSVVYSFADQQAIFFADECNRLTRSPFDGKWSQACKDGEELNLLHVDGRIQLVNHEQAAPLIETIAQSIFYDGSRAVFVDPNYQFIEIDASGEKRALPVYWTEGVMASVNSDTTWLTPLQWTKSGERVLVYAYSLQQEDCPYRRNQGGELRPDPCWLLLENGKIVWHLQREKLKELGLNWDNLYTNFEAAISPQDDAIILVISDMPVDFVLLSYFEDGNVEFLLNGEMDKIVWKLMSR